MDHRRRTEEVNVPPMRAPHRLDPVLAVLVVAVALFAAAVIMLPKAGSTTPTSSHGTATGPTAYRTLSISFDPKTGTFDYTALQLSVPLNVIIVFTIMNYDASIGELPAPRDAQVAGTVGGTESLGTGSSSVTVGSLAQNGVSHTFSMSNAYYHLNAPIPPADGSGVPMQVSFSVVFHVPGTFDWGCVILCGPSDMTALDAMYGSLTVS
jgi:hypothetical protein